MFEWKVEDMALLNEKSNIYLGKEKIYSCENKTSREDKIAFVDSLQDGKLSYILNLINKFNKDKEKLPKTLGNVKTVSLKAWIKRNDPRKLIRDYSCGFTRMGSFYFLSCERNITYLHKGNYDTYEDLVDEIFHRLLRICEKEEKAYFLANDEYSVLKKKVNECIDNYRTSFGVPMGYSSNGEMYVYTEDYENSREITIDELKELLSKYEQLDTFIEKITKETSITY